MTQKLYTVILLLIFCNCNKNTDELPPPIAPPGMLVIPATLNGLSVVDFIFYQTKTPTHDTVWLSIRNRSGRAISKMKYLAELCNAVPQNYTNCNLQLIDTLRNILPVDSTIEKVYTWVDQHIHLDNTLINTGIISCTGIPAHPIAGAYQSTYVVFETANHQPGYYGNVRGYILADGTSTFRLIGDNGNTWNVNGLFTRMLAFGGLLNYQPSRSVPFHLDPVDNNTLTDTSNGQLKLRLGLDKPATDTIQSLLIITQRI